MAKKKRKLRRVQQIRAAGSALSKIFSQGELQLLSLFASTIRFSTKAPNRITGSKVRRAVHRTADRILGEVGKAAQKEAAERLTEAYESTAERIARFAEQLETDVAALRREDVPDVGGSVEELTRALDASWNVELRHMRRDADDICRAIVEVAMNDRESSGESVRSAMQKALNQFAAQGITGFTDKAGRRWGLEEYTDMAMRTAMQRASMQATIDSMVKYGWDLCFVNAHMGACPLCQKWQGVIMSLTGKTLDYPTLQEAMDEGLFHPNCAHILQIYFPEISVLGRGVPEGYTNAQSTELYEARQRQRAIERNIRKWKRLQAAAASPEDERYAQAMVRKWQLAAQENAKGDVQRRYDREGGRVLLSDAAKKLKPFTIDEKGVIINSRGGKIVRIERPIEQRNTGKGNPNAILHFDRPLNARQASLLEQLPEYDSRTTVRKKKVNMRDLAALTASTGDEFAMFTRKGERLIVRGNGYMTNIDIEAAQKMAAKGYRWSGHTHPGTDVNVRTASPGDYTILQAFRQKYSVIYDAVGKFEVFGGD